MRRFGLGVREIFEISWQKTHFLIPPHVTFALFHVNATGQVSCTATTEALCGDGNVGVSAGNGAKFSYANATP